MPCRPQTALRRLRPIVLLTSLATSLAGCTWYHQAPLSLADTATSQAALSRIRIDASSMPLPTLSTHRFDPSDGLDIDETAMLAVVNNPDLKLTRDDLGIARAQAFSAGLLPDPQLAVDSDYPGLQGATRAFNYGLSIDVVALLTRSANMQSANAALAKIDLGLLWQEWQVVAQAKQLFLRAHLSDVVLPMLQRQYTLNRSRYEAMAAAAKDGNLSRDAISAAMVSYDDAWKAYNEAQRAQEQTHHDLNLLLGLAPDVALQLVTPGVDSLLPTPDLAARVTEALDDLPRRRPDLIALQAGYASQEQRYRAAIMSQFPTLTVGFNRARDTSNIYATGFQISLSLPIFNRNRGNIAIENTTRQKLRDDYQIRFNQAVADVTHLQRDIDILSQQLRAAQTLLPDAKTDAMHAQAAYAEHNITLNAYTDAETAALTKSIAIVTLREALGEQCVALQALLGSTIPDAFQSDLTPTATHVQ